MTSLLEGCMKNSNAVIEVAAGTGDIQKAASLQGVVDALAGGG